MRLHRLYIDPEAVRKTEVFIRGDGVKYLRDVLRLRLGNQIAVFDGTMEYVVELGEYASQEIRCRILSARNGTPVLPMQIAFSALRPGPTEEILRHCTELGATGFVPILAARSNRRPTELKDRWSSIVVGAAAQCGRIDVPKIASPTYLSDFLAAPLFFLNILLTNRNYALPVGDLLENSEFKGSCVLCGPEGGFEADEEALALAAGFKPGVISGNTLRSETAIITAAGIIAANNYKVSLGV